MAGMAKLADAADLKSAGPKGLWGFDSPSRHQRSLPDTAYVRRRFHHGLTRFAGEGFREVGHVYDDSVDAVARGRVRVRHGAHTHIFGALVGAIPLGESNEEALLGSEAVDGLEMLVFVGVFPGNVGKDLAAQVGYVFAERELAVDVNVFHRDIA